MARSDRSNRKRLSRISDRSFQEPAATEPKPAGFKISNPAPQRQLSLLALTIILNILLWSSVVCVGIAFFQLGTDSEDHTNVLPGVLTLISSIVTVAYTAVHTTYSVKQRALTYQQLDAATIKKTTYIANRLVVSLCVLWLLTAGWNMILVARRPSCLPNKSDGQSWEAGVTCIVSRVGMALAMIALVASLTLFGMMAAIRRPFEAHLFAYGQRLPHDTEPSPPGSRRTSGDHMATEKLVGRNSTSTYTHTRSMSRLSNYTNADVETLDLNASRPASIIHAPSPSGDRIEIFTSPFAPPPVPPGFILPRASSPSGRSQKAMPAPFAHQRRISLTPRTDALLAPAAYIPNSIPIEFSASAQRAVYPDAATPYRSISTCRSQPHLRSMSSFSNRHRYSRSSVSLSRPHRLSTVTPVPHVESSSRTNTLTSATCVSDKSESLDSKSVVSSTVVSNGGKRASAAEIVSAIANNAPIPGTEKSSPRKHWRTVSTPNASVGAQQRPHSGQRMAMGWKPVLSKSSTMLRNPMPLNFNKLVRSASADLLGRFGPLANADAQDEEMAWKKEFEREIEDRLNDLHTLPFPEQRKSVSTDGETLRESFDTKSLEDDTRFEDVKEVLRPVSRDIAIV